MTNAEKIRTLNDKDMVYVWKNDQQNLLINIGRS